MGYMTRTPTSNEPLRTVQKYSGVSDKVDLVCLILNGCVRRCSACGQWCRPKYLTDGKCPDCQTVCAVDK